MVPSVRHPAGAITPAGAWRLLRSDKPHMGYLSYDNDTTFDLLGPLAPPFADRQHPYIALKDIKGLVPPWKAISQKGATQDGETFVTSLYDPLECDMVIEACGRTPADAARVLRDWTASWDAIQEGELFWFTPQMGRWWAKVRWAKNPAENLMGGTFRRQRFTWPVKAYDSFWRSYDDVDQFRFGYSSVVDEFDVDDLTTSWDVTYGGTGSGAIAIVGGQVTSTLAGGRVAAVRRKAFTSSSDNQVVEIQFGSFPAWSFDSDARDHIWARMNTTGTPGTDGIRMSIGNHHLTLSYLVGGVETVLRDRYLLIPPLPGEKWTLVCGQEDNPRHYKVLRGLGIPVGGMDVVESGTASLLGSAHRGVGFGLQAGSEKGPATIRGFNSGDNATVSQSGFVTRVNVGDQPRFDRYTVFGPGLFSFADGPNSSDTVTFGPLLAGQVAQIRTDPRKRSVVDLTSTAPTPQQKTAFQQAIQDFVSFATGNNTPPLLQEIESLFGIQPPQGNLYSLLQGRFSDAAAIPPKPTGKPAPKYAVKVAIDDGNADSRILCAGTPLRRFPI